MSWWLKGAIEERGCQGQGCSTCPYRIYSDEESFACEGDDRWDGYGAATKLWYLLNQPERGRKLSKVINQAGTDEEGTLLLNLAQIEEAILLFDGLRKSLCEFTGNKHIRFDPIEMDWIMKKYSDLVTHWKNPDGTEVYTLVNALTNAEETENYLRGALRVRKPVLLD